MLSKKEVKDIQSLALKKNRDAAGLFIAEGPKIVSELAALFPGQLEQVFATPDFILPEIAPGLAVRGISEADLEKISQLQTPNKVLALVKKFRHPAPDPAAFTLYLDAIQDPGNLGTIIRIADWFGVSQIVCGPGCADLYNPKVVQSTMASIARVAVHEDGEGTWIRNVQGPVYAAALEGNSLYKMPRAGSGVLLIGNESKGLRPELLALSTEKVTIPRRGSAESLNAAVATGIILSHLLE